MYILNIYLPIIRTTDYTKYIIQSFRLRINEITLYCCFVDGGGVVVFALSTFLTHGRTHPLPPPLDPLMDQHNENLYALRKAAYINFSLEI